MSRYVTTGRNSWHARTDGYQRSPRVPGPIYSAETVRFPAWGWAVLVAVCALIIGAVT